ncbi:MAG: hypothetical protein ACREN2_12285 [Candidatus Dormibacteria bacterium]
MNIGYGVYKVGTGATVLAAGTAASVALPIVGDIVGAPAIAYGGYQCITGGARLARGSRLIADVIEHPDVHASPAQQGIEFLRDAIIPFGQNKRWDDLFGSLP